MKVEMDPVMGVMRYSEPKDWAERIWLEDRKNKGAIEQLDPLTWREKV